MQAASGGRSRHAVRPAPPIPSPSIAPSQELGHKRRMPLLSEWDDPSLERRLPGPSRATRLARNLRVARRIVLILGWTALSCVVQSAMLILPGRGKVVFAACYWSVVSRLMGMRVRVLGKPAGQAPRSERRPVIYVCNHSSWIDVPVLGGKLHACFVAKEEVGGWPLVGTVARLGRTLFVSRQRKATGRERDDMSLRLKAGDDLILFPEGTSSDGSRVLPFHSSFFAAAKGGATAEPPALGEIPLIQPVSVVYDQLGTLPVGRANRTVFSWYGDMDLAPHFIQLARWRGMRASIWLHDPLDPVDFASRKALSQAAWTAIARGCGELRQNRAERQA
ncbi:1-acyl-sn-glycerol-3-phosphate acyltransferase [Acetobacteraceae bacterium KSS8]|uniref:1-acyl-sn-glycerol-3-phosphate acyltransferase n=1 Tax=Endosaccharibacter trunci TaxID=2812733 RepID=A0ABT1WBE3_9PROT|nr:1-acyl-sn-glycerol-3-phosphate acyltransferase [Acetobacteraceae bacterium KSS8]